MVRRLIGIDPGRKIEFLPPLSTLLLSCRIGQVQLSQGRRDRPGLAFLTRALQILQRQRISARQLTCNTPWRTTVATAAIDRATGTATITETHEAAVEDEAATVGTHQMTGGTALGAHNESEGPGATAIALAPLCAEMTGTEGVEEAEVETRTGALTATTATPTTATLPRPPEVRLPAPAKTLASPAVLFSRPRAPAPRSSGRTRMQM